MVWTLRPLQYRTSPGYSFLWEHSVPPRSSRCLRHKAYRQWSCSGWSVGCRSPMNTCTGCHTECPGGSSDPQGRGRSRGHWCSVRSSTHQCTGHMIPFLRINIIYANIWLKYQSTDSTVSIKIPKRLWDFLTFDIGIWASSTWCWCGWSLRAVWSKWALSSDSFVGSRVCGCSCVYSRLTIIACQALSIWLGGSRRPTERATFIYKSTF